MVGLKFYLSIQVLIFIEFVIEGFNEIKNVDGHGYLLKPVSRNYYQHLQGNEYCQHCLNAGGVGAVQANAIDPKWPYPETDQTSVRHGMCGDPAKKTQIYLTPIPASKTTLEIGTDVEFQIHIDAHHNGYFEFTLCNLDTVSSMKQSCLVLLNRASNDPSESPIDPNHPERYYLPPKCAPQFGSTGQGIVNMRYHIPSSLAPGDNYVLQWYWLTANTCRGPDYPSKSFFPQTYLTCSGDGGSIGWQPGGGGECLGTSSYPEEFWNCADIKLVQNSGGTSNPATPSQKPTTKSPTSLRPTSKPTTKSPTVTQNPSNQQSIVWDTSSSILLKNGSPTLIKGFAVTCMEYLLRGIGTKCLSEYQWNNLGELITKLDMSVITPLVNLLKSSESSAVTPAIRVSLNAAYYLDVSTSGWSENRGKYPNLSNQYKTLIENVVGYFTSNDIVVILDLHWNDDVSEQEPMALRDQNNAKTTGDSILFWTELAKKFGQNPLVLYELYNEPYIDNYNTWAKGTVQYAGMKQMMDAIRAFSNSPIIIAGSAKYAYDSASIVQFENEFSPQGIIYNLHPYMGPYQAGDTSKTIDGYINHLNSLVAINRPIIITEFGQYCCASDGACYLYPGTYKGKNMGFVEALLTVNKEYKVSWTAWAWRPNSGSGDCNQPDANDGNSLYDSSSHSNQGAPWSRLFGIFYPESTTPTTKSPTSPTSPEVPSKSPTTRSPTTRSPTSRSPTSNQQCAKVWEQCGGLNFNGGVPICCESGTYCNVQNDWYSQCLPQPQSTASPSTPKPTVSKSPTSNQQCAKVWEQCGGLNFNGGVPICCETGTYCYNQNPWYSQCLPN